MALGHSDMSLDTSEGGIVQPTLVVDAMSK
jgi:hypothetical protein